MVIVVIGLLGLVACSTAAFGRRRHDPIIEHQRAIETLREIASRPRPDVDDTLHPYDDPTHHIRLLSEPPERPKRRARQPTRAAIGRPATARRRADYMSRPTIANLPTIRSASGLDLFARPLGASAIPEAEAGQRPDDAVVEQSPPPPVTAGRKRRAPARVVASAAGVVVLAAAAWITLAAAQSVSSSSRTDALIATRAGATTSSSTSTTTTLPARVAAPPAAPLVSTSGGNGTVNVTLPFTLTLRATSGCWVQVRDPTGAALFTGALLSGQQQQIRATAPVVVRLGNTPGIVVSVNDAQLDLAGLNRTADLTLVG